MRKNKKNNNIKISLICIAAITVLGVCYNIVNKEEISKSTIGLIDEINDTNETLLNLNDIFTKDRIYGEDEIDTSVEVAKSGWSKSEVVIIANKNYMKEGFIASPLSRKYNAPILLSESESLDVKVKEQIEKLEAKQVLIIGDENLISSNIEKELIKSKLEVNRIKGIDITDFSIKVAEEMNSNNRYIISTGNDINELVKLSSIAISNKIPIIISENYLSSYRFLRSQGNAICYFAGDNNEFDAIFYGVNKKDINDLNSLKDKSSNAVVNKENDLTFTNVVLASPENLASTLCGEVICGVFSYPLIHVEENTIDDSMEKLLLKNIEDISHVTAIGDESEVSDDLMKISHWGKEYSNAKKPLVTPTYDGSNQAVHPKVIYIENGWNGYKYWMGLTPYPNGNDDYENPQILVSNDGIEYNYLNGMNKPLDIPTDVKQGGHYSDIDICIVNDVLEVYFRHNPARADKKGANNTDNNVFVMISKDGVNWSEKKLVLDTNTFDKRYDYVSPIIIYDDNKYKIWFSNYSKDLYYTETTDWKNFKEVVTCNFKDKPSNFSLWHNDVIKTDLGYEVVINGYSDKEAGKQSLYYTSSKDGVNFLPLEKILDISPDGRAFDNGTLYKSSLVKVEDKYLLYYSARSKSGMWRIGLAENKNNLMNIE